MKRKRPVDTCGKVCNVIVVQVGKNSAQLFFELINRKQLPIGRAVVEKASKTFTPSGLKTLNNWPREAFLPPTCATSFMPISLKSIVYRVRVMLGAAIS